MPISIPPDFDVKQLKLDQFEMYFRDKPGLNMQQWARFRHTIYVGNHAEALYPLSGLVPEEVKEAYRQLAKSHYEVICSLGWAKQSLIYADGTMTDDFVFKEKSVHDFYFYLGRLLDNIARLIYIINDPDSPTQKTKYKGAQIPLRHWIDWGGISKLSLPSRYATLFQAPTLAEIVNIRNVLTHSWAVPKRVVGHEIEWPLAIRTEHDFLWWYDERSQLEQSYNDWLSIRKMMYQDFGYIEDFQSQIFALLAEDVVQFEKNHNLEIRVPGV